MKDLKPDRIILHCGLHKTGSTFLQTNCQCNHENLLLCGILYIDFINMKKKFSELWQYVQFGNDDTESNLRDATYETLAQLGSKRLDKIHTILLSSEEIFGPLKDVLTTTIIQAPNL